MVLKGNEEENQEGKREKTISMFNPPLKGTTPANADVYLSKLWYPLPRAQARVSWTPGFPVGLVATPFLPRLLPDIGT